MINLIFRNTEQNYFKIFIFNDTEQMQQWLQENVKYVIESHLIDKDVYYMKGTLKEIYE